MVARLFGLGLMGKPILVLASGSPRRKELLTQLGVSFSVVAPPDFVEEGLNRSEVRGASDLVQKLALAKCRYGQSQIGLESVVVAADTVVVDTQGHIFEKPEGPDEAMSMLRRLAGKKHVVLTGLCIGAEQQKLCCSVVRTEVFFRQVEEETLARYVATKEPLDKAGAYGIQGVGGLLVKSIVGPYDNVVGLPCAHLDEALLARGYSLWDWMEYTPHG